MRNLNDAEIHWWKSRWWTEDQYIRAIEGKISIADVDAKIEQVARIFDASWGARTGFHPVLNDCATLDCVWLSRVTCTIPDLFGNQATKRREPSNG
jgi:hypothetical protein